MTHNSQEFYREALFWRQLRHPYITPFYGVCVDCFAPHMAIVTPWMPNGNLLQFLRRNDMVDRYRIVCNPSILSHYSSLQLLSSRQLIQIADALKFLHERSPKVIHGDVRGANVLVNEDGHACLADFGLAVVGDSIPDLTASSSSHNAAGAVRWLAPELLFPDKFPDNSHGRRSLASDVYSYGCVCIEVRDAAVTYIKH
jgi:serine/threonine protein kinase